MSDNHYIAALQMASGPQRMAWNPPAPKPPTAPQSPTLRQAVSLSQQQTSLLNNVWREALAPNSPPPATPVVAAVHSVSEYVFRTDSETLRPLREASARLAQRLG
ncbi:MAG: hypothetical protein FJX76_20925 [Armatimonadetes bacterium]|nr:hypothetical protein [Armatimonadota bacterium]